MQKGINKGTQSSVPVRQVSVVVLRVAYQSDRCQQWYSECHISQTGISSGTQSVITVR